MHRPEDDGAGHRLPGGNPWLSLTLGCYSTSLYDIFVFYKMSQINNCSYHLQFCFALMLVQGLKSPRSQSLSFSEEGLPQSPVGKEVTSHLRLLAPQRLDNWIDKNPIAS